jgi:hypothetical protein
MVSGKYVIKIKGVGEEWVKIPPWHTGLSGALQPIYTLENSQPPKAGCQNSGKTKFRKERCQNSQKITGGDSRIIA